MKLLLTIVALLLTHFSFSQDSVKVKVLFSEKIGDSVHYLLRIPGYGKVETWCCCKQRKKGEVIMTAKKDLIFYKR